jgi:hypothetical protein
MRSRKHKRGQLCEYVYSHCRNGGAQSFACFAVTLKKTSDQDAYGEPHQRYKHTHVHIHIHAPRHHRLMYREGGIEIWIHRTATYEILTERDLNRMCFCGQCCGLLSSSPFHHRCRRDWRIEVEWINGWTLVQIRVTSQSHCAITATWSDHPIYRHR